MKKVALLMVAASFAALASAQRTPLGVSGYNFDGIADGPDSSLAGVVGSTTGVMDSIYDYYTQGFDLLAPTSGLPAIPIVSAADPTTTFLLAAPTANNVLLLRQSGSGATSGTLTLSSAGSFQSLAFLLTGFNGSQPGGYQLNFSAGPATTGSFTATDNFNGAGFAISGFGRVSRLDGVFDLAGGTNPRLYQVTVGLSVPDQGRVLQSITFTNNETSGTAFHNIGVFGVSGQAAVPEPASLLILSAGAAFLARRRRK